MKPNLFKWALAPLTAAAILASPAAAAVVTFDMTGNDDTLFNVLSNKAKMSEGEVDATFRARQLKDTTIDNGAVTSVATKGARLVRTTNGAGVLSRRNGATGEVDGISNRSNFLDMIEMRFQSRGRDLKVSELAFTFARIGAAASGSTGDFFLIADSDGSGRLRAGDAVSDLVQADTQAVTLSNVDLFGGNLFGVVAGQGASWTLKSVSATYTPVVPLPAGGLLLLTGLGGLAFARSRKG
jgi:transcriptional regulator of acetoin/glycerol metabolism